MGAYTLGETTGRSATRTWSARTCHSRRRPWRAPWLRSVERAICQHLCFVLGSRLGEEDDLQLQGACVLLCVFVAGVAHRYLCMRAPRADGPRGAGAGAAGPGKERQQTSRPPDAFRCNSSPIFVRNFPYSTTAFSQKKKKSTTAAASYVRLYLEGKTN